MPNPNKLKDSKIELIPFINDEYIMLIPGYKCNWSISTFFRFLLFGGLIYVILFLIQGATQISSTILLYFMLFLVLVSAVLLHTSTKIKFSKHYICVSYAWLPYIRKRKTKNFKTVLVEYNSESSGNDAGGGFNYVVLVFSKQRNIKIMVDQLTRKERDFLTSKLYHLKSKLANDQYIV